MKNSVGETPARVRSEKRLVRVFLLLLIMLLIRYVQWEGRADVQKHSVSFKVSVPELSFNW